MRLRHSAQGKEEKSSLQVRHRNNANDNRDRGIGDKKWRGWFENKEMYLYEGEWVETRTAVPPDGWQLFESVLAEIEWSLVLSGKSSYMQRDLKIGTNRYYCRERRDDDWLDL